MPAASGGGDPRNALLAQIQAGKKLASAQERSTPAPAPDSSGGRDGLLAAIQQGVKLKHTEPAADAPKAAPKGNDLASTLANAMASRRGAQESDSDEDSDWDDD